jgi:hypothetical protein
LATALAYREGGAFKSLLCLPRQKESSPSPFSLSSTLPDHNCVRGHTEDEKLGQRRRQRLYTSAGGGVAGGGGHLISHSEWPRRLLTFIVGRRGVSGAPKQPSLAPPSPPLWSPPPPPLTTPPSQPRPPTSSSSWVSTKPRMHIRRWRDVFP